MAAAQIFPNTVFVQGFPASISRFDLMKEFGGSKGMINQLHFTTVPGEPKKAFIVYENPFSVPLALQMNGVLMYNQHQLVVHQVDEMILCDHVPGENNDVYTAFKQLKHVLRLVAEEKKAILRQQGADQAWYRTEVQRIAANEYAMRHNMTRAFHDYKEEHGKTQRNLTAELTRTRTQLETIVGRCSNLQAESEGRREQLAKAEAQLKAAREAYGSMESDVEAVKQQLHEACAEKESNMERLGIANDKVNKLQEDLKLAKDERSEARSSLWRAQSSLGEKDMRAREAESRAAQAQTKRQRAEEWLTDERERKRRLAEDVEVSEARCRENIRRVEQGVFEREQLEKKLRAETAGRKEVEKQLAEARAKLDKVVVTDALLAAFTKMEDWTIQMMEASPLPTD